MTAGSFKEQTLNEQLKTALDDGLSQASSAEYEKGYQAGFQDGISIIALALAARLGLSARETLSLMPEGTDESRLLEKLTASGIRLK